MDDLERILVTVRTYPTPSTHYQETVCIGGISEDGQWRRLYPVSLRYLWKEQQFRTWDVVQARIQPAKADSRPESRRAHLPTLEVIRHLDTWPARCDWVRPTIRESLQRLQEAGQSLAPVAVASVKDLVAKKTSDEWDGKRARNLKRRMLFDPTLPLEKIPYEFRLIWEDEGGAEHDSLVISWELAQTWRQYRHKYSDPIAQMRTKLLDDMFSQKNQVAFFMGNHSRFRNIFMVCGWFIPPRSEVDSDSLFG
ncbi:MAG: hypothetical protein KAS72_03210 [Phycisphaerales bacterium]|nr:hypothetical protein [Phycisphaerales bacterium]